MTAARLSPQETRVARYVAQHMLDKEIAFEMGVSDHTVKKHIQHIFAKLRINRRSLIAEFLKPTLEQAEKHAPHNMAVFPEDGNAFLYGGLYTLAQLEAACVIVRQRFGPGAVGLHETINNEVKANDE